MLQVRGDYKIVNRDFWMLALIIGGYFNLNGNI